MITLEVRRQKSENRVQKMEYRSRKIEVKRHLSTLCSLPSVFWFLFMVFMVLMPNCLSFGKATSHPASSVVRPQLFEESQGTKNGAQGIPSISDLMTVVDKATTDGSKGKDWSTPVKLVIIFTGLAVLPRLLVMMTSFTRIVIVLSFVRRALSTQTIPPTVAIIGLALFLTLYTMAPTYSKINSVSIQPYLADKIDFAAAGLKAGDCIKEFMLRQSRQTDLALFVRMAGIEPPASPMDINLHIVIPAFIISEFRTAFEIGCLLFIPFLLVDMVMD